ncbi:MAG: hypothetical protein LBT37_06320 [Lactobacillaceae bacterium]|jgi:hypothetical protein|nr:hypothetical protein [Lactobacillaceae bacterium]
MNEIVEAIQELTTIVNERNGSPWLNQKQAVAYSGLNRQPFLNLVKQKVIPVHSLYPLNIARELYNKNEIDKALSKL